jgi:hypothetical protein
MQTSVLENYLRDLGHLLKSEALEAAEKRDAATESERPFLEWLSLGYINVLSFMLNQAKVFDIAPEVLNLANFDPDTMH